MLERDNRTVPGKRPLLPWLRFLHLRTYGRTHLAVAWRVAGYPASRPRPDPGGLPAADLVSGTPRKMPDTPCARR